MNTSSNHQYCLELKYLITGFTIDCKEMKLIPLRYVLCFLACMNFYGRTSTTTNNQSRLFATFCIPYKQPELHWYFFNVSLPENITMVNKSHKTKRNFPNLNIDQCSDRK